MTEKPRKAWLAGLLSFLMIGLGRIYNGKLRKGFLLYFAGQGLIGAIVISIIIYFPKPIFILFSLLIALIFLIYTIIDAVLAAKRTKEYKLRPYNRWYFYLLFWILAAFVIQPTVTNKVKSNLIQAFRIPSGSMLPTIFVGDYILAKTKLFIKNNLHRGDIVIFKWPKDPSKNFIMRAIALGGDEIKIVDKKVYINGLTLNEPYVINEDQNILLTGDYKFRDNFGPVKVPDDCIFVLGDNRDRSNDSRFWGFVQKSSIVGRASSIYWSYDNSEKSVRWERLGKYIK
ncbi:MAG: signal peptidase I [Candidatus Thorarchaeota archaeon]